MLSKRHENRLGVTLPHCLMVLATQVSTAANMKSTFHRTLLLTALLGILAGCGSEPVDAMWTCRPDDSEDDIQPKNVSLIPGGGIEVKDTANATLWRATDSAKTPYRLSMRVQTTNLALHAHGAGIAFGGRNVDGDKQAYTYFLVRGDGYFLVKTRDGDNTNDICPWTEHDAITKEDSDQKASNVLSVTVGKGETRFLVNGTEVYKHSSQQLHTIGKYGVRLVHDLSVRFDQIELTHGAESLKN